MTGRASLLGWRLPQRIPWLCTGWRQRRTPPLEGLRGESGRPGVSGQPAIAPCWGPSPVWVMVPDSVCSCLSASTVTTGAGRPSATSAGQAWISVQPRFGGSSAWGSLLSLMVAEHSFDQIVSVPHPDDELASHFTSGNLGVRMPGWTLPAVSGLGGCRRPPA